MRERLHGRVFACVLGLACAAAVWAGPLNRALVDRDATWIVHVDAEAAARSSVAPAIVSGLDADILKKIEDGKKRFGLGPGDIRSLTVYGMAWDDDGLAVLTTSTAADALAVRLPEAGLPDFKNRVENNVQFFSFTLEKRQWHVAVRMAGAGGAPDERVVMLAATPAALEHGLRVISGTAPSLAAMENVPPDAAILTAPKKGSMLFVLARNLSSDRHVKTTMLRNSKTLVLDVGETTDNAAREFYMQAVITAVNPAVAEEMRQTVQGLIAMASMMAREGQEKDLIESLRGVEVTVENDRLLISSHEPSDRMVQKIAQVQQMFERPTPAKVKDAPAPTQPPAPGAAAPVPIDAPPTPAPPDGGTKIPEPTPTPGPPPGP